MAHNDFLHVLMRDLAQQIQLVCNLIPSVVIEDNKSIYRIIDAVEQPVHPMGCVNTSRTNNGYGGRRCIHFRRLTATMLTLNPEP